MLVTRFANGRNAFHHTRILSSSPCWRGPLSTTVSATLGVGCLALGSYGSRKSFGGHLADEVASDLAAVIVVAPVRILWTTIARSWMARGRVNEAVLPLASIVLVGAVVYAARQHGTARHTPEPDVVKLLDPDPMPDIFLQSGASYGCAAE
jgi:hypothetical protein